MSRRLIGSVAVLLALAGCASVHAASAGPSDRAAWVVYRRTVTDDMRRVLGPSEGVETDCAARLKVAPAPSFGIDVRPTLRHCAAGDLSDARMLAHQQIDKIATNDRAVGLLP